MGDQTSEGPSIGRAPLVSIITPCLNPGWRLQRCIDSIARQTYPHVQHWVVDGGSTDETVDMLGSTTGVEWVSEPDRGQSDAINKGFDRADGTLLGWLNADDELMPDAVERVVARFVDSHSIGWVHGSICVTGAGANYVLNAPRRLSMQSFAVGNPVAQPGAFITRWAWEKVRPLRDDLHYAMDYDLWLRLLTANVPSSRVSGIVARFEVHDDSKGGSVPFAQFALEAARAALDNSHPAAAAALVGRAAGMSVEEDGGDLREALEAKLNAFSEPLPWPAGFPRRLARGAARVELATRAMKRRQYSTIRLLASTEVWGHPAPRRLLAAPLQARLRRWSTAQRQCREREQEA